MSIGGLAPSTTYHFRILARNADGTNVGTDQPFTTLTPNQRPTKPRLSRLLLTPDHFRAAQRGASVLRARAPSTGTLVTYSDTTVATTEFTVERKTAGHRSGRRGVRSLPHTLKHKRSKRCSLEVAIGRFRHSDKAGANGFHFSGRVAGHALPPDTYTLIAVAKSASASSNTISNRFHIRR
jgi:hypothetical protein